MRAYWLFAVTGCLAPLSLTLNSGSYCRAGGAAADTPAFFGSGATVTAGFVAGFAAGFCSLVVTSGLGGRVDSVTGVSATSTSATTTGFAPALPENSAGP